MVDVSSLSEEERSQLLSDLTAGQPETKLTIVADEGTAQADDANIKHVVVDGIELDVNVSRIQTWRAASLMAKMESPKLSAQERFFACMEFYEFVFGSNIDVVVDALGGDMATTSDVMDVIGRALREATPKN